MARVLTILGSGLDVEPSEADFITTYARYADVLEAPRAMHEAVATLAVAAVLNCNSICLQLGAIRCPLDLWCVFLSGSGLGRNTVLSFLNPILDKAGMNLLLSSHWGSPQAFYQDVSGHTSGLFMWSEFSEKLKLLNDRSFSGVKEWFTDHYDNLHIPDAITFRDTGRKSRDTPSITFLAAPRINVLATSSEEWFFNNVLEEDSMGGFVPRWMIVRSESTGNIVPVPKALDDTLVDPLVGQLRRISALTGEADLSAITGDYEVWYRAAKRRFSEQPNQALATAFFNRHRMHVLKLAVVYEASSSASLVVSDCAWNRAQQTAADLEKTIFSVLPTAISKEGYALGRMAERVRSAGAAGLSRRNSHGRSSTRTAGTGKIGWRL